MQPNQKVVTPAPAIPPVPVDKYDAPAWLGKSARRRFHAMAKPAGSACNLDCVYCYYQ